LSTGGILQMSRRSQGYCEYRTHESRRSLGSLIGSQHGDAFMKYKLCFQDFLGNVFSTAQLSAADDEQAIKIARRIYKTGIGRGYEIQCQNRVIHRENSNSSGWGASH
jgi:hypothetical protein